VKALIAAFALLAPTTQPAAAPPCIHPAEVEHAIKFAMPVVFEGLAEHCQASLPASAYLLTGGADLSKRLAAERTAHWEGMRAAFVRIAGAEKAGMFSADTVSSMARDLIRAEGAKDLTAENCSTLDRALALLAPLPPENLAGLVTLAMEQGLTPPVPSSGKGDSKKAKAAPPPILCPAAAPAPSSAP
jgi:hypothetical protein